MSAWSHLPNAALIDRVLADLRRRPDVWEATWDAFWVAAHVSAWDSTWEAAWVAARDLAQNATRSVAWEAALMAAWSELTVKEARDSAWGAIAALIAWDHAGSYLDLPRDQIQTLMFLGDHVAILLLPAVIALESQREMA